LKIGQKVWFNEIPYLIKKINGKLLYLKILGDEDAPVIKIDFRAEMANGTLLYQSPFLEELRPEWDSLTDEQQDFARKIFGTIEPYFNMLSDGFTKGEAIQKAALEAEVSDKTIRERVKSYQQSGLAGLACSLKKGGKGMSRLNKKVEELIELYIDKYYLKRPGVSVSTLLSKIHLTCGMHGLPKPNRATVQKRIDILPEAKVHAAQKGRASARNKFHVSRGSFPGANAPLSVVQFDHTPLDMMIVDNENGISVGRPYLTIGIDVYSRAIYGFFLTLQPPAYTSIAMCLLNGIQPKDKLMEQYNFDAEDWPTYGLPACIHVDNGKDFRSKYLADFCREYQINLEFRPIRTPQYGGHVERIFRTINTQLHEISGTTYSSVHHKGDYESEKNACLTLDELEEFLVACISEYHLKVHKGIKIPPKLNWDKAVYSGLVAPYIPKDEARLIIDILPYELKQITKNGIAMFALHYTDEILQPIRNAEIKSDSKHLYKIKYDPRDISKVYLLNPLSNKYETIYLSDRRIGNISKIELDQMKKVLKHENESFNIKNLGSYQYRKEEILEKAMSDHTEKRYLRIKERIQRGKEDALKTGQSQSNTGQFYPTGITINPADVAISDLD